MHFVCPPSWEPIELADAWIPLPRNRVRRGHTEAVPSPHSPGDPPASGPFRPWPVPPFYPGVPRSSGLLPLSLGQANTRLAHERQYLSTLPPPHFILFSVLNPHDSSVSCATPSAVISCFQLPDHWRDLWNFMAPCQKPWFFLESV